MVNCNTLCKGEVDHSQDTPHIQLVFLSLSTNYHLFNIQDIQCHLSSLATLILLKFA